ncbi:MAG: ferrous iron transport protein A [Flavobacteriales bacterium]|nr:ferrous iron transport protein A [Flavobacteriales bacterium]
MTDASQLPIGSSASIVELTDQEQGLRLLEIGVRPGKTIRIIRTSPFKGAVFVQIGSNFFALRQEELSHILID